MQFPVPPLIAKLRRIHIEILLILIFGDYTMNSIVLVPANVRFGSLAALPDSIILMTAIEGILLKNS